ncbi:S-layer homology domain-containing protein [Desertibacillus haloalkaliphilus]|uniref:S-layer homology domain-containing protein n=1 Tax=Desertibacillus haloalkaliphilus TaxID=1328930 RepID=UPI001C26FBC2|nr:S-layer homology domain-containing protein [Desertibacillus haloalkaliphilus]MBU8905934.1 S-layer homology domain-containing protein [Desertibacillus haloalkaliphilus]
MAYQPKSYRKFLATSVSAAVVATAGVSAVSAAPSFPDVPSDIWYADAVSYLVEKGAINGMPDGTYAPSEGVTRAQASAMLADALELELSENPSLSFTDTSNDAWYAASVEALVNEGIIQGLPDGSFAPGETITRAQFAEMVVDAYGLEADASVEIPFNDTVAGAWYEDAVNTLYSLGVVNGMTETTFGPGETVNRAQAAVFLHRTLEPSERVTPVTAELEVTAVNTLTSDARYVEVEFNKAVSSLSNSDVRIQNKSSEERVGVKDVQLAADGKTATIEFFEDEGRAHEDRYLERGVTYTITVSANGESSSIDYERPFFTELRVTSVSAEDREFNGFLKLSENFDVDFEEVLGQEIRVWYNSDFEVERYVVEDRDVALDAVELEENNDGELEVTLVGADETFDLVADSDLTVFVDGKSGSLSDGDEFDYAKVVFDRHGDVAFINAYNWDSSLLVEEVDGYDVFAYGEEKSFEDFTIVKDGKTISLEDVEAGDVIFYNDNAEYAEVFTSTVVGPVETVFSGSIEVNGEEYDYQNADRGIASRYIDEDGDFAGFGTDAALQYKEAEGDVTLFLDRAGNLHFIDGDLGIVETDTYGAFLEEDIIGYAVIDSRPRLELSTIKENGEDDVYDFPLSDLEKITVNGTEYEVGEDDNTPWEIGGFKLDSNSTPTEIEVYQKDNRSTSTSISLPLAGTGETVIEVTFDEDEKVVELEFFTASTFTADSDSDIELEAGDRYVEITGGADNGDEKRIRQSTPVFIAEADEDVEVTTWGELEDIEVNEASVYFDGDNVTYLVLTDIDADKEETEEEGVVTELRYNSDDELDRIKAYINGEIVTLHVDEDSDAANISEGDIEVGEPVEITIDDNSGLVLGIEVLSSLTVEVDPDEINVVDGKFTIADGSRTFELEEGAVIYDATDLDDIEIKSSLSHLRSLEADNSVKVVIAAQGSDLVKKVIITAEGAGETETEVATDGKVTYINSNGTSVDIGDENFTAVDDAETFFNDNKWIVGAGAEVSFETNAAGEIYEVTVLALPEGTTVAQSDAANVVGNVTTVVGQGSGATIDLEDTGLTVDAATTFENVEFIADAPTENLVVDVASTLKDVTIGSNVAVTGSATVTLEGTIDADADAFDGANAVDTSDATLVTALDNATAGLTGTPAISAGNVDADIVIDTLDTLTADFLGAVTAVELEDGDGVVITVSEDDYDLTATTLTIDQGVITAADDYTLTITADNYADITQGSLIITEGAVAASESSASSIDGGDGTATIKVTVKDQYGNPVSGLAATDFVGDDGTNNENFATAPFSAFDNTDNANGVYEVTYTNASNGTYTLTITVDSVEITDSLSVEVSGN